MKIGIVKKCDKCGERSLKQGVIKRVCFMIHFPYYDYAGFDLCNSCLNKLEKQIEEFFK